MNVQSLEQTFFLSRLRTRPPDLFRKGVGLKRPTCSAALETFTQGHPENYIRLANPDYNQGVSQLRATPLNQPQKRRQLCQDSVGHLMKTHQLIPMGRLFFTLLVRPEFTGWSLSELNQLDLSHLQYKDKERRRGR